MAKPLGLLYHAKGDSYPFRALLRKYGWEWDPEEKVWFLETDSPTDYRIYKIEDLSDLKVVRIDV